MGTPSEMYTFGTQYWMIGLSYPLVVAATAHIYLPVFYRVQPASVHQYLELRCVFNRGFKESACIWRVF